MPEKKPKLEIDWIKTFAGALAAVSSAVLLSTLGAAGTLIGAAVGSLTLTITSAFYSQGLARSRAKLAQSQKVAAERVIAAQSEVRRALRDSPSQAEAHLERAEGELDEAQSELEDATEPAPLTLGQRLALLPWKQLGLWAVGLFLMAVLLITAFELVSGRSISSFTGGSEGKGGTSIGRVIGGYSNNDTPKPTRESSTEPTVNPAPTATSSGSPSVEGSPGTDPGDTTSPTDSGAPGIEPSPTVSEEPLPPDTGATPEGVPGE